MEQLSIDTIRELISYNSETGIFTWKERSDKWFESDNRRKMHNGRLAGAVAGSLRTDGYYTICILGYPILSHRLAYAMHYGKFPDGEIDHRNGVRADNRIENLRDVSRAKNLKNKCRYSNNTSGVTGVTWFRKSKKWQARITIRGRHKSLGLFHSFDDAVAARKRAESEYGYHKNHGRNG